MNIAHAKQAMTRDLPPFLQSMLAAAPQAGEGVHGWLFRVSRQLHAHLPAVEIVNLLERRVAQCGRHVSRKEIEDAVKNSLTSAWRPSDVASLAKPAAKWPAVNQERREAIIKDGSGLAELWEVSNPRLEDSAQHSEEIIERLFPGNPLLCCGRSQPDFDTRRREGWRGELVRLQFIVPSPMSAESGTTKEGKPSKHTLNNTGPRRFLICEFDSGERDEQAALLEHLGGIAPLVCVVFSGGKSLHGWFFVEGEAEERVRRFFGYAVSLGADSATWTRSQFVRMPDGIRGGKTIQRVFFLNFKPMEAENVRTA
jgi:hypothetical protein